MRVTPKADGAPSPGRVPVFVSGWYATEGELVARVVWMPRLGGKGRVVLGACAADDEDGVKEGLGVGLRVLSGLLGGIDFEERSSWIPLAEYEPKGRRAIGEKIASDLGRFPFLRIWDAANESWSERLTEEAARVAAGLDEGQTGFDEQALKGWAALHAVAEGQEASAHQRVASPAGLPPMWSVEQQQALEHWDGAELMAEAMRALLDRDPELMAEFERGGLDADEMEQLVMGTHPIWQERGARAGWSDELGSLMRALADRARRRREE